MSQYKILFIVSITLLCSCKQDTIYRQKLDINSNYWRYNDSLKFSFEIADTSLKYSIELDVMHRDSFPFENCYVQIKSTYPDKKVKSDMLSLEFADETGKWLGKSKGENLLVPIAFQTTVDRDLIGKRARITAAGRIERGGKLLFISDKSYPVIRNGQAVPVEMTLKQVTSAKPR